MGRNYPRVDGYGYYAAEPVPDIPDGYMILSNNVPAGDKMLPHPHLYRVKPIGFAGFGYPLPSLVAEACWLRQLLGELCCPLRRDAIIYCENISVVYLSTNPVQHQRTKHVEIDLHFVRERVALGEVRVMHVPTSSQYADIFTKGLPTSVFTEFRFSLNVRSAHSSDCGGVLECKPTAHGPAHSGSPNGLYVSTDWHY
jgi:hypothetical protein